MRSTDKRKQSLYFPEDMLSEIQAEAQRQDRSMSWIVQKAWSLARGDIAKLPTYPPTAAPVDDAEARQFAQGKFDRTA